MSEITYAKTPSFLEMPKGLKASYGSDAAKKRKKTPLAGYSFIHSPALSDKYR